MNTLPETTADILPSSPIRVETALSRYPVHRLAKHGDINIDIRLANEHGEVSIKWEVTHNSKYKQPGPLAYKLDTLIINRRIEEAARPIPTVIRLGSLHEICRELGISEGKNVVTIKNALYQNAYAAINAKIRYRGRDGNERNAEIGDTRYGIVFTGQKLPDGRRADAVYIVLHDFYKQILNDSITRPLDYDYLKSLNPAPQRFYELLSYQMYAAIKNDRPRAKLLYSELCTYAPLVRQYDWNNVRPQLARIHAPHKTSGYITKIDFQDTVDVDTKPDWIMLYQPGPKARAEYRAFTRRGAPVVLDVEPLTADPLPQPAAEPEPPLVAELVKRGVSAKQGKELVRNCDAETIRLQIDILDFRLAGKKAEKIDDPAAWLVAAIKHPHTPPKGFVSSAERQRREEIRQAKEREKAEERRRKQEEDASERETLRKVDAYLKRLDQTGRIALEAKVLAAASPAERETYESQIMAKYRNTLMLGMIRQYLAGKPELEQITAEA
jgi:hypothetical protein